jgi:hypothetical protein
MQFANLSPGAFGTKDTFGISPAIGVSLVHAFRYCLPPHALIASSDVHERFHLM